jgi:hypothetical protein
MIVRETDRVRRAGILTGSAEDARAEIEPQRMKLDGFGRTGVDTRATSVLAQERCDIGTTSETLGQLESVHGARRGLVPLSQARSK